MRGFLAYRFSICTKNFVSQVYFITVIEKLTANLHTVKYNPKRADTLAISFRIPKSFSKNSSH